MTLERKSRSFIIDLLDFVPELRPIYEEHLDDQDGELLNHLLFGAYIVPWVLENMEHDQNPERRTQVLRLQEFLDMRYPFEHESVRNIIDVSFLESLQGEEWLIPLLGPHLRAEYQTMFSELFSETF